MLSTAGCSSTFAATPFHATSAALDGPGAVLAQSPRSCARLLRNRAAEAPFPSLAMSAGSPVMAGCPFSQNMKENGRVLHEKIEEGKYLQQRISKPRHAPGDR